jgi:hypothetical protein
MADIFDAADIRRFAVFAGSFIEMPDAIMPAGCHDIIAPRLCRHNMSAMFETYAEPATLRNMPDAQRQADAQRRFLPAAPDVAGKDR